MLRIGFMLHAHELNLSSYQKSQNLCCIEIMKVTREIPVYQFSERGYTEHVSALRQVEQLCWQELLKVL